MKKILFFLGVLLFNLIGFYLKAQTDTEFWFVKPNITEEHTPEDFKIVVTARDFDAEVQIEMPAEPGFPPVNFTVPAFTTYEYNVFQDSAEFNFMENNTVVAELSEPLANRDNIGNKAILLTSTAPVNAYFTQVANNNSDIYALKGGNGIGTEFIIPFQEHGYNQRPTYNERGFSSVDIISYEDGTVVEIIPPTGRNVYRNGLNPNYGAPYTVTLDRGQVYTCPPAWDPTVTRNNVANSGWWGVEGNQRLGGIIIKVLSGEGVAVIKKDDSVRKYSAGGWDIIADQWVPYKGVVGEDNDILGTEYLAMRGNLDNGWEYVYVAAPEDNTRIWWGNSIDTSSAPVGVVLDRGEQHGILFDKGVYTVGPVPFNFMEIISNKPLSVLHVSGNGREMGGAVLPPIDRCTGSTSVSFTRDIDWPFYINIMARAGHETDFLVDGVVRNDIIDPTSFVPVGSSGEWVATQLYYAAGDVTDFPVGTVRTISNTSDVFHLGLINGNSGGGCRFGYFSDFNELRVSANTIQGDGSQPSSTIRACKGDTVQLYASGGSTFDWWPADNLSSTTISNPTAVVDDFRTYFVEVSGACNNKDTATVTIEMANQPEAVFFMEKSQGCAPLDLKIRNLSTDINQIYWDFNASGIGGGVDRDTIKYHPSVTKDVDTTFIHTFYNTSFEPVDSPQVFNVQLKVKSTKCTDILNTDITLYPEVTADFTLSDLNDSISCNPATVDFESSVLSINEDYYKWNFGDGALSADPNPTHEYNNFSLDTDTTYTSELVVRSQWFCRDTARMDITVHPYLEGGFTINEDKGCSPLDVRITNISSGADTIFIDYGDGTDTVITSFNYIDHIYRNNDGVDEVDTNIIVMRVKNDEGCEFIDRDTVYVYPEFVADYTIDGDNYEGCNSRLVTFTNTTSDGTHLASRYLWEFADGTSLDTTNNAIQKFYNNTTLANKTYDFRLTARSSYGCTDDTTNTITIYRAAANFTVDNNEGCSPLNVRVTNTSIGDEIDTWNWDYGDGIGTSTNENPFQYTYNNNGIENDTNYLVLEVSEPFGGCSTTDTVRIVVYPEVQVSYIENHINVPGCDSLVVEFNSTLSNPALPNVTYEWDFGDGGSSSAADVVHVYKNLLSSTSVNRAVKVRAESNMGCYDEATSNITVNPRVKAMIFIDQSSGCSPLTVDVNAQTYPGISNYSWDYGDGSGTSNNQNPTPYPYPANQSYASEPGGDDNYGLILEVDGSGGACIDSDTVDVTVYSEIVADFTPDVTSGCNPLTVNFTDNSSANADAWNWDFDDGSTYSKQDTAHTFFNTEPTDWPFNVKLDVISDRGCTHSVTKQVTVRPYIKADFDINISEDCSPLTVTITNNSSGTEYYWYWDKDDRNVDAAVLAAANSTTTDPVFTHEYLNNSGSSRTDSLTLIVGNGNNCYQIFKRAITVHSSIDAQFTYSQPSACNPSDVTFTSTTLYANNYKWNFGDGSTAETTTPVISKTFTNNTSTDYPFTVNFTAESPEGCTSTTSDVVTVHSFVEADFDINLSEDCSPLTVNITNNSSGTEFYWFWDDDLDLGNPDSNSPNPAPHTYTHTTGGSRTDYLTLIVGNGNGCYDTLKRAITIHSSIDASFVFNQPDSCTTSLVTFDASGTSPAASEYNWDFGDGTFFTTTNPVVTDRPLINTLINDKDFHVQLTAETAYGCTDTYTDDVTVYSRLVADFSIPQSASCPPFTDAVIQNTSIGNNANTYQWFVDGSATPDYSSTGLSDFVRTYDNGDPSIRDYSIRLLATNPHGCTKEKTDTISVYERVIADFDMNKVDGCTPLPIVFANNSQKTTDTKYLWTFGDGATSSQFEPTGGHKFYNTSREADKPYTIGLKVTSENYCTHDTTDQIWVYHQPLAKFFIDNTSSCPPLQSYMDKSESLGEDMWEWRFGDGSSLNTMDETLTHDYNSSGTGVVDTFRLELWVGTNEGCRDSSSLTVNVFPSVTADFDIIAPEFCSPVEVGFTNNSSSWATNYTWRFDDGNYSNNFEPEHRYEITGSTDRTYRVYLKAATEYNCWDTITKPITVYVQPYAEFSVDNPLLKYPENAVTFDNQTTPLSGPFDYLWEFDFEKDPSLTSTNEEPGTYTYQHWGEKVVKLTVASNTNVGCTDNYLDTILIQPPDVNADFTTNIDGGCFDNGLTVQFDAFDSPYASLGDGYNYEWDFDDGTTTTGQNVMHTFEEPGVYNVQLTASSTIPGLTKDYEYKKIYVYPNPEVNFEVSPKLAMLDPTTLEARVKFYNNTVCNDTAGCAYTWDFGDGNTAISKDVTHAYAPNPADFVELEDGTIGIYYDIKLVATTEHGCKDSLTYEREVKIIGAGQIAFPNAFTPDGYGPPENETFKPLAEGVIEYELFIYNRWGELIFTTKDLSVGWDGTINGEMAKPDVYVWKAQGKFTNGRVFEMAGDVTLIR